MRRRKGQPRILKKFPRLPEITQDKGLDAAGIEVWFADEARIGQKNKITRRWAKRGTRPSAPHDQISAPSAPPKAKALCLSCPPATARPWLCISGNLDCSRPRRTCHPSPRSGGMACLDEAARTKQHHALAVAAEITRAHPRRKHLAIYARQLALKPHLQILRRHFGPLLFCLEQTHRHALENNVHGHARLGTSVIISETRY